MTAFTNHTIDTAICNGYGRCEAVPVWISVVHNERRVFFFPPFVMDNETRTTSVPDYTPKKMIPLPRPPKTKSPVPWLTSIHSTRTRGPYGDSRYRGNCSGYLIKDVLRFFQPKNVLDPMSGSGTCSDVCRELDIPCTSFDLRDGKDAANPRSYEELGAFDFIWMHPPYWRQIIYSDDPNCMSNATTLDAFLRQLRCVIKNCHNILTPTGHLAILMGNYQERGKHIPLTYLTMHVAIATGLWPACPDIIRFQHGNTSSSKSYDRSFIPGLHDVCMIFGNCDDAPLSLPSLEDRIDK